MITELEVFNQLDKRIKEKYNRQANSIQTDQNKWLFFDQENGFPLIEFTIKDVKIKHHPMYGPRYVVVFSEFDYAFKLIG